MGNTFTSVDLSAKAAQQIKSTNYSADKLLHTLRRMPDSREKSLALTKLEECVMWANKAASRTM